MSDDEMIQTETVCMRRINREETDELCLFHAGQLKNPCLVPGYICLWNGETQYLWPIGTDDLKPVRTKSEGWIWIRDLILLMVQMEEQGFVLPESQLLLQEENRWIRKSTGKACFFLLPVQKLRELSVVSDAGSSRRFLSEMIQSVPLSDSVSESLVWYMEDDSGTLKTLADRIMCSFGSGNTGFCIHLPGGESLTLDASKEYVLGKGSNANVRIEGSAVISRRHVRLFYQSPSWYAEDLGSRNGSWIGEKRLEYGKPAPIHQGEKLRLADQILETDT